MKLEVLIGEEKKIAKVIEIKRSDKIPPRLVIQINKNEFILELDNHDDERILKGESVYREIYLPAYIVSSKRATSVYIKKAKENW